MCTLRGFTCVYLTVDIRESTYGHSVVDFTFDGIRVSRLLLHDRSLLFTMNMVLACLQNLVFVAKLDKQNNNFKIKNIVLLCLRISFTMNMVL